MGAQVKPHALEQPRTTHLVFNVRFVASAEQLNLLMWLVFAAREL